MNRSTLTMLLILTLAFAASLRAGEPQAFQETSRSAQEATVDPLTLPFPERLDLDRLERWVSDAKQRVALRMHEARLRGDGDEVARAIVLLERVRAHGFRELRRLGAPTPEEIRPEASHRP